MSQWDDIGYRYLPICWDEVIKIGHLGTDRCRSMYVNATWLSLILCVIIWNLFSCYFRQLKFLGMLLFRLMSEHRLRLPSTAKERRLILLHLAWAATGAFPLFYSHYILFMYLNDGWLFYAYSQTIFSLIELMQYWVMWTCLERRWVALCHTDNSSMGSEGTPLWSARWRLQWVGVVLELTFFQLFFNARSEWMCRDTRWDRNILMLIGDVFFVGFLLVQFPTLRDFRRNWIPVAWLWRKRTSSITTVDAPPNGKTNFEDHFHDPLATAVPFFSFGYVAVFVFTFVALLVPHSTCRGA